jgi:hypothetical protein
VLMKRIYLILTGLILSFASFAIGPITGAAGLCVSGSATLSDSSPGGVWSSSNATVATIGTAGVVGGVAAGTANITYSIGASYATTVITVNADPAPISGAGGICNSATVTLTDATSGGNWYSSAPGIAGIGSASGTVTGVSAGTAMITYILPTGKPDAHRYRRQCESVRRKLCFINRRYQRRHMEQLKCCCSYYWRVQRYPVRHQCGYFGYYIYYLLRHCY